MDCVVCFRLLSEYEAATKQFARSVAMMTATVGNADFHVALALADKCYAACEAVQKRLNEHRASHNPA